MSGTVAGVMESGVTPDQGMAPSAKLAFFDIDDDAKRSSSGKATMELPMPVETEFLPVPYRVGEWGGERGRGERRAAVFIAY